MPGGTLSSQSTQQGRTFCITLSSMAKRGRPATGQTPVRAVRVGPVWDEAKAIADARGDHMAVIVDKALRRYIAAHGKTDTASRS